MLITATELELNIVQPCLNLLGLHTLGLSQLLVATAIFESSQTCPQAMAESPTGAQNANRGRGIFRITAKMHRQLWDMQLIANPELASRIRGLASQHQFLRDPDTELEFNLAYACAMAAIIYLKALTPTQTLASPQALALAWSQGFDNGTGDARSMEAFIGCLRAHNFIDSLVRAA